MIIIRKNLGLLLLLFMVLLTNDGFCRDMGAIPGGIDSFFFRMRYISKKHSCSDSLTYTIDGKGNITGRILFKKENKYGKEILLKKSLLINSVEPGRFYQDGLLRELNYKEFLSMPEVIMDKTRSNPKIETVTYFELRYTYRKKSYRKAVKVVNFDTLLEKTPDKKIMGLLFIKSRMESLEHLVFEYGK